MPYESIPPEIQQQRNAQIESEIIAALTESPGMRGRHIWEKAGKERSLRTVTHALDRLLYREAIIRKGNGLRENPYLYFVK